MMCVFKKWTENAMKKMDCLDMKLVKLSVFGFTLLLAKVWPPLLSLEWYWYGLIGLLAMLRPMYKVLKK